jgi:hypothetical protein
MKKCFIFHSKFSFNICFKSTKKLYKMATITFRRDNLKFLICSLKIYMTWSSDFWSKIIRNILKFFIIYSSKIYKLTFLESLAENIENGYFHYLNMFSFCFLALVYTLNHTFLNENTIWEKFIEALFD